MATVYLAEDVKLEREVALALRSRGGDWPRAANCGIIATGDAMRVWLSKYQQTGT